MMAERGVANYIQVFKTAWNNVGISNANIVDNDIKLGSAFQSTLYAPTEACRGEDFIISVFLHKTNDCDEIEIRARNIDSDLSKRNQLYLKTKINKGDLIEFQVYFNEKQYYGIEVDEHKKEIYWDNSIESVEFIFTVDKDFTKKFFIGKIKLAVNKELIGDMVYKINIVGYAIATLFRGMVIVAGYMGNVPLMLVFTALASFGISPLQGDMNALIASCSEYTTIKTGKCIDGMMFSCSSLGIKVGGAIGTAICGWLLDAAGYIENATVQTASTISMMRVLYLWVPMILCTLVTIILTRLKVETANEKLKLK